MVNAYIPVGKRGHKLETEVKLKEVRHPFLNEASLDVAANFQLIL